MNDFAYYEVPGLHELDEPETKPLPILPLEFKPHSLFRYRQYRWELFSPDVYGYAVIRLNNGYFTIVDPEDAERATQLRSLRALVSKCPVTGKTLKVRAIGEISRKKYYLHRFLTNADSDETVDHFNRLPLDNRRRKNLVSTTQGANLSNRRKAKGGLLSGVEQWGEKYGGKIQYEGEGIRSSQKWSTQEPAHEWYLAKHQELYGYTDEGGMPLVRSFPQFPPRVGHEYECPF